MQTKFTYLSKLLFILLMVMGSTMVYAQEQWEICGNRNISGAEANYTVLKSNAAGTLHVLFNDKQFGDRASVMAWDGSNWNFVGPRGFTTGGVIQRADIAFDPAGNIWVVATQGDINANDNLEVWKYDGSSWNSVGPTVERSGIEPKIEYFNGDIYVTLAERINFQNGISLRKYDGGAWSYVGTPHLVSGFGWPGNIAFSGGEPYVSYLVFQSGINKAPANVKKYNGSAWVQVGAPNFSAASGGGNAWNQEIEFSASGTLHMAYYDDSGNNGLNVMKFDNSTWVQVGAVNFTRAFWCDLEFDGNTPYVGFQDLVNGGASVMTLDGSSWDYVVNPGFSPSSAYSESLDINNGLIAIAFTDPGAGRGATVMKLGQGSVLDADDDGVADDDDNCPLVANPDQADNDQDGEGDVCDADDDNDGISDDDEIACGSDPLSAGSTCEICDGTDNDGDGDTDEGFADSDNDGLADCVDDCPLDADNDSDGDGICGDVDNCPTSANADQADNDQDGEGDVCDADDDNDGCLDDDDSNPLVASGDADCDGVADDCDVCAGGDDSVDNNNDGLPDCAYPPSFEDILDAWKCSNNANNVKVLICHIPPGNPANAHTICVSEKQAKKTHLDKHGDYLGPCTSCTIPLIDRQEETFTVGKVEHLGMTVFPNPANDQITIRLEEMGTTSKQINIYNNLGSLVWKGQIGPGQSSLQVDLGSDRFQSGVYTIVTQYEGEVFTEKLVINK